MSDFGYNIRRIAKTRELEAKIDQAIRIALAANKSQILGERVMAYITAGAVVGVELGSPGQTPFGGKGTGNAGTPGPKNIPGAEDTTTEKNNPWKTDPFENAAEGAKNAINNPLTIPIAAIDYFNEEFFSPPDKESPPDGKGGGYLGDRVSQILAENALTGYPLIFDFKGQYRTPPGWSDPNTPPTVVGWQLGYWWAASNPGSGFASTPSGAANMGLEATKRRYPDPYPYGYADAEIISLTQQSVDVWLVSWIQGPGAPVNSNMPIYRQPCTIQGATLCPATVPIESSWPEVGNYILGLTGGLWTPHPMDSEVPTEHKMVMSKVNFGLGDGRYGIMQTAIGGGHIMYEVDGPPPSNTPIGTGMYIRPDNTIGRFVPAEDIYTYIPL